MQNLIAVTWRSLYADLVNFVLSKVKDKATAEDIVQEVFIKVFTRSSQLKESEKISGWIFQITRNAVADHFRRNAKPIRSTDIDWEGSSHEFNECVAHCLKTLMGTLPDKYRIPLYMAEINEFSQQEIAARLNLSHSGARSRVQRGRRLLKEKLEELYYIKTDHYGNVIACEDKVPCCCNRKC
jgi:RNA polymerase sigma-70 factor, ECF subfamily